MGSLIAYIRKTIGISGFVIASSLIGILLPFAIIAIGYCIEILGQVTPLHYLETLGKATVTIGLFIKSAIFSSILLAPFKAVLLGAAVMFIFIFLSFTLMEEGIDSKLLEKMYDEYILAKLRQNEELAKNLSKKIAQVQVKYMRNFS